MIVFLYLFNCYTNVYIYCCWDIIDWFNFLSLFSLFKRFGDVLSNDMQIKDILILCGLWAGLG